MKVVIIDCGAGNLRSVEKSFLRAAEDTGRVITVTRNFEDLAQASHIVLPGVGAFADCMSGLMALTGMREALEEYVRRRRIPFLGICVGMQMLFERGLEHGEHAGLGWLPGEVVPIVPKDASYKIPHMGWNDLVLHNHSSIRHPEREAEGSQARGKIPPALRAVRNDEQAHPLFKDINTGDHVYFVHSFHARCGAQQDILASVEYGDTIVAAVARDNIMGTQFHPEKSQDTGICLIRNFLTMNAT